MSPTLIELVPIFKDSLLVIATGFVTFLAAGRQIQAQNRQAHNRLMLEKIERASALCQLVYDGHRSQCRNLKRNWIKKRSAYFEQDRHPGAEMSELKTIIRCYFPELSVQMKLMDTGHNPLKNTFRDLADGAASPTPDELAEYDDLLASVAANFDKMESGTTALKQGLANESGRYLRRRLWPRVSYWLGRKA